MPARKRITREKIVAEAMSMLEKDGYDTITVKTLTARLGCSTQPIYLSFKNMGDLRKTICETAVRKFKNAIGQDGNLYGMEYILFARDHKNLFRYLFMRQNAFSEMKAALSSVIERSEKDMMERYHLTQEQAEWKHDQLWMHSHGIATMMATDFCDWDISKAEKMVEEAQNIVLQQ